MRPTPRARALRQPVREALQRIEHVLAPPAEFEPATYDRSFSVLAGDGTQVLFVPALSRRLGERAPRARLDVRELVQGQLVERLASGEADLALCFAADLELPASMVHEPLLRDRLVCVVREDLEGVGDRLDWESFAALGQVVFLPRGTAYPITQSIDRALQRRGLERRRCLTLQTALLIPAVLSESDYVATIPERSADHLCRWFPIRKVEPPFRHTDYAVSTVWDVRHREDPAHRWLRSLVREIADSLGPAADTPRELVAAAADRDRPRIVGAPPRGGTRPLGHLRRAR
jgi:DNA-binding transcriptional LysR family regulator